MSDKQWRRSYSVRPETAVRLERMCRRISAKPTPQVERALHALMDEAGEPVVSREEAIEEISRKPRRSRSADYAGHHFTW